jgi:hypothetical protein
MPKVSMTTVIVDRCISGRTCKDQEPPVMSIKGTRRPRSHTTGTEGTVRPALRLWRARRPPIAGQRRRARCQSSRTGLKIPPVRNGTRRSHFVP